MPDADTKQIQSILKYDPNYMYFGALAFSVLYDAYRNQPEILHVGKINGDVICDALWRQMAFNPVRFGNVSPFVFNGKNDIYRFCRTPIPANKDVVVQNVLIKIQNLLKSFLVKNAKPSGQWSDEIITNRAGYMEYKGLRTYVLLSLLRDSIQAIITVNRDDFRRKRGPYRNEIIRILSKKIEAYNKKHASINTYDDSDEYMREEFIDRYEELNQTILDAREGFSHELVYQAYHDKLKIMRSRMNQNQK